MKKLKIKLFFLSFIFVIVPYVRDVSAVDLWLKNIPIEKLYDLYDQSNYKGVRGFLMIPDHTYPTIFLKNFPLGYDKLTDEEERNALFIKIVAPLALKLNQELLKERDKIKIIKKRFDKGDKLSKKEIAFLETKAEEYDIFTRLKDKSRQAHLIAELLNRVDQIPPSIIITAAAIDSNWGTVKSLPKTNSLYKAYVWYTDEGIKPEGETEDDSYRLKSYPDIYASIKDFALKINSHIAFSMMRVMRAERRQTDSEPPGLLMAPYIYGNSPLMNYAGLFDYTLAYYELLEIDKSSLADKIITKELVKKFEAYRAEK